MRMSFVKIEIGEDRLSFRLLFIRPF